MFYALICSILKHSPFSRIITFLYRLFYISSFIRRFSYIINFISQCFLISWFYIINYTSLTCFNRIRSIFSNFQNWFYRLSFAYFINFRNFYLRIIWFINIRKLYLRLFRHTCVCSLINILCYSLRYRIMFYHIISIIRYLCYFRSPLSI